MASEGSRKQPQAPLWRPDPNHAAGTRLQAFLDALKAQGLGRFRDYEELRRWSVARSEEFWPAVWEFTGLEPGPATGPAHDELRIQFAELIEELLAESDGES